MRKTNQYQTRKHTHITKKERIWICLSYWKNKKRTAGCFCVFPSTWRVFFHKAAPEVPGTSHEAPVTFGKPYGTEKSWEEWCGWKVDSNELSSPKNILLGKLPTQWGREKPICFFCFCRVYYVFREIPWGLKKRCVFFCLGKMLTGHVFKVGLAGDFLNWFLKGE